VLFRLGELMIARGLPNHIRSDNGPAVTAAPCAIGSGTLAPGRSSSSRAARGAARSGIGRLHRFRERPIRPSLSEGYGRIGRSLTARLD
jgi:hypothetical protein